MLQYCVRAVSRTIWSPVGSLTGCQEPALAAAIQYLKELQGTIISYTAHQSHDINHVSHVKSFDVIHWSYQPKTLCISYIIHHRSYDVSHKPYIFLSNIIYVHIISHTVIPKSKFICFIHSFIPMAGLQ